MVNRALLNAQFPAGPLSKNTGTVQFDSPDRKMPNSRQASIGYERQLGATMAFSADYIRNDLRDGSDCRKVTRCRHTSTSST